MSVAIESENKFSKPTESSPILTNEKSPLGGEANSVSDGKATEESNGLSNGSDTPNEDADIIPPSRLKFWAAFATVCFSSFFSGYVSARQDTQGGWDFRVR
jgi:hypothetical protein